VWGVQRGGNYQHAKHADARGNLGMSTSPPWKFLKKGCSEIESEGISESNY